MKDSGVEWIGEIPIEWSICRLKNYATILNGQDYNDVVAENGSYPVIGSGGQFATATSFLYDKESVLLGRKGTINKPLYINRPFWTVDTMYYTSIMDSVMGKYFYYLCTQIEFDYYQYGSAVPSMTQRDLNNVVFPLPDINTQHNIAAFLDTKCAQIDAIIEKQQQVIEKLRAYKQSVITEAVTKGLDPTVPMKDSGVEWIGEVPEHWKTGQLKYFATIRSGITLGKKYPEDTTLIEYPYLRVANVQGEYTDLSDVAMIAVTEEEAHQYSLQKGEVLMTEGGDRDKLGRGCIWNGEIEPCLHQNHVFALRTNEDQLAAAYFDHLTTSDVGRSYFDYTAKKTTNLASTNSSIIMEFRIPIPPIDEQRSIVYLLQVRCASINAAIKHANTFIEKIGLYKKALIYEAVTGKLEV